MTKTKTMLMLGLTFGYCTVVAAQEDAPPPVQEQRAAVVVRAQSDENGVGFHTVEMATSDGGGDVFTFAAPAMGGAFFMAENPMESSEFLLNDPGVQKNLEILDSQREQIQQMQSEFGKEIKTTIDEVMKSGKPGDGRIMEAIKEINQRKKERLSEILLPHQVDRLKQISLQMNVNQAGLGQALASKALSEELGIDDEQKEKLKQKAQELAKELEQKVAKMKEEMREELMGELTSEQREKLKKLMGEKYDLESVQGPLMPGPRAVRGARSSRGNENN